MTEYDVSLLLQKPSKEVLTELLRDHGEKLRKLKAECGANWQENEEILDLVWKLLALKRFDPELGSVPPEHRGPFTMKIRWRLDPADGTSVRFQNIFKDRIYLTGEEVSTSIHNYMKKAKISQKHPHTGEFVKIELIEQHVSGDKKWKTYRALTPKSIIRMPLQFPGPWLSSEGIIEFRVYWPGKPYHMTTPNVYKDKLPQLVDAGVNLFSKEFSAPNYLNVVIRRAFAAGVSQMALISVDHKSSLHSVELAKKYRNSLFALVGVHPVQALEYPPTPEAEKEISELVQKERKWIIGVGECGIDFEKVKESDLPKMEEAQEKWLRIQLKLASDSNLPLFLHQRGGHSNCMRIIKEHLVKHPDLTIVVNCFSGTHDELKSYLSLNNPPRKGGMYIVITGLVCSDDRGAHLRSLLKDIPLSSLLLATDAPHLTPYNMTRPYPRRNEPGFLPHVLVSVAECLGLSFEEVAHVTTENARKAFGMPSLLYKGGVSAWPREIIVSEFQKDEDNNFKPAGTKKSKPKKILLLTDDQTVLVLTDETGKKIGFVVSQKENSIMQKQEKTKTPKELLELAGVMELQRVEANTIVTKPGSDDPVFTSDE